MEITIGTAFAAAASLADALTSGLKLSVQAMQANADFSNRGDKRITVEVFIGLMDAVAARRIEALQHVSGDLKFICVDFSVLTTMCRATFMAVPA